ncbi:hypothetical protein FACS1894187_23840 [Synergistales bacterium]|nr:hypothetical protein FACS1894187_23840 [Synergistales bacterium]
MYILVKPEIFYETAVKERSENIPQGSTRHYDLLKLSNNIPIVTPITKPLLEETARTYFPLF